MIEDALPDARTSDDPAKAAICNRLLIVLPQSLQPESSRSDAEAAAEIIAQFARRAWRRPVTDDEKLRLMQLYEASTGRGRGFLASVREPLKAVLVSPHFLFVVETEPDATGVIRLTPHQIATRLALFIWSSIPDEELLQVADSEAILNDDQIRLQVRRMLADPKSRALGENFGLQWLGLRGFGEVHPDEELFPEYAETLASDLREEAVRFVAHVFQQNRPLTDLVALWIRSPRGESMANCFSGGRSSRWCCDVGKRADCDVVSSPNKSRSQRSLDSGRSSGLNRASSSAERSGSGREHRQYGRPDASSTA